jgi:hypothetical protein
MPDRTVAMLLGGVFVCFGAAGDVDGCLLVITRQRVIMQDSRQGQGMSVALYSGLAGVRGHTPNCAVLAVNNHYLSVSDGDSRYFYYSAFAERRVFLERWPIRRAGRANRSPTPARLTAARPSRRR